MAKKRTNAAAKKKLDKQLDKLLKEKKEIEDIEIMKRMEIHEEKKPSSKKKSLSNPDNKDISKKNTTSKKKEAIVTPERKRTSKKKDVVVVKERKSTAKKENNIEKKSEPLNKKKTATKKVEKKEVPKKTKSGESTIRMKRLEREMRSLYDKVNDVVDDFETEKIVDQVDNIMIADVAVIDKKEEYIRPGVLDFITAVLFVIFIVMVVVFMGFVYYVCTY